ncbi:hypothetical protein GGS21DRAFT_492002 [Xylaria nigripes]|nr:hypothetical protein GGS21DRAFT_492002 [Xylaria nigripes]
MSMGQDHIDSLLERYLHLLHEYTSLREELTALQTSIYQNIARANFAAERGMRFGQDYYDDRMQASKLLSISYRNPDQSQNQAGSASKGEIAFLSDSIPSFSVISPVSAPTAESSTADIQVPDPHPHPETEAESAEQSATKSNLESDTGSTTSSQKDPDIQSSKSSTVTGSISKSPESLPSPAKEGTNSTPISKDPLRWFGLLTPMPLRQAQTQSVRAIEHVIPRLASVNAEMVGVEIEVRRARKKRAKAEAAASKLSHQNEKKQENVLEA